MKRRAPTIWALVVLLVVGGLAYRENKVQKANARAAAQKKLDEKLEADKQQEKPEEPQKDPLEVAPAPQAEIPESGRFHTMPDGSPIPSLPESAPKKVKLGVVLFRYEGAQGASDSTRSREAALKLADEATQIAQDDFAAAVKKGDRGSSENIGWIGQRVLERSVEHGVFTLEKGEISKAPIDTPRGFWVAKRVR